MNSSYPLPAGDLHRPWSASSGFERNPYGNTYPGYNYSNVGAKRTAFDESCNVGAKRTRSDDSYFSTGPPDPYPNENFGNSSKVSSDNERRLKLIRDHGSMMNHEADRNLDSKTGMGFKGPYFDQESGFSRKTLGEEQQYGQHSSQADRQSHLSIGNNWQCVSGSSAGYNDHRGLSPLENRDVYDQFSQRYTNTMQPHMESMVNQYGSPYLKNQSDGLSHRLSNPQDSRVSSGPPLPASPPPPLPVEPPGPHLSEPMVLPGTSTSLFPIQVTSSAVAPSSYPPSTEASSLQSAYHTNKGHLNASTGIGSQEFQANWQAPPRIYFGGGNKVGPPPSLSPEKPKIIDASHIIKHPHRANRPDCIVIILRGLPGSGKSYLAKMLRDLEVENGGNAPRIHSMDDYFMTEVEKIEETEVSKSSGSVRGKKQIAKKVIEYCYEPEMEEAYRSSMLKAFKKTLDEGVFSFIIEIGL